MFLFWLSAVLFLGMARRFISDPAMRYVPQGGAPHITHNASDL
jgi:hypothetical protein